MWTRVTVGPRAELACCNLLALETLDHPENWISFQLSKSVSVLEHQHRHSWLDLSFYFALFLPNVLLLGTPSGFQKGGDLTKRRRGWRWEKQYRHELIKPAPSYKVSDSLSNLISTPVHLHIPPRYEKNEKRISDPRPLQQSEFGFTQHTLAVTDDKSAAVNGPCSACAGMIRTSLPSVHGHI